MPRRAAALARAACAARAQLAALNDRDLLARYATGDDQAAFAVLLGRHAEMVLGVCRRLLRGGADAEDACQAVFLLLARKAKSGRWQVSVANWLYTTARKVAHNARLAAARRARREGAAAVPEVVAPADAMTARELTALLDEELEKLPPRYREPLILCYLQGLTRDEAATRLAVPVATLKSQLERGRKRLAGAITARGGAFGLTLLTASTASSLRASTPRLVESILFAVGGSPSEAAVALTREAAMSETLSRAKLAMLAVVGAVVMGSGVAAVSITAAPPQPSPPAAGAKDNPQPVAGESPTPVTITGSVVGLDGKPVAGARVATLAVRAGEQPAAVELATTDENGRFAAKLDPLPAGRPELRQLVVSKAGFGPDWVNVAEAAGGPVTLKLAADDVPVAGRVTDLEGKPIPKATVRIKSIAEAPSGDLSRVWADWARGPDLALRRASKLLWTPVAAGFPETITADVHGRFELRGVGRGRLLGLLFEADGIETAACRVVLDPEFDPKRVEPPTTTTMPGGSYSPGPNLYGPTFTHTARPSQPIVGTVRDARTGEALAGVHVGGNVGGPHWWENHAQAKTSTEGRFTLRGIGKAETVSLSVFPGEGKPYFPYHTTVSSKPGLTAIPADLKLTRGVRVKGRVVDAGSGKPVPGAGIRYTALADNKHFGTLMSGRELANGMSYSTDADGRFELVVLPGAGIILAQGETRGRIAGTPYTQVRVAKADLPRADLTSRDSLGETFSAADGHIITLNGLSGYSIIEPEATDEAVEVEIRFHRGRTVTGAVIGPTGTPATGVTAYKLAACYDVPQKLKDGRFTAVALEPDCPRTVLFVDEAKKLSAAVTLRGDEKNPTAKLQPWGKLTGRLLDAEGEPVAGATVRPYAKNSLEHAAFNTVVRDNTARTDAGGRFAVELPSGGAEYVVGFMLNNGYLNTGGTRNQPGAVVRPGETTDLGDLRVQED